MRLSALLSIAILLGLGCQGYAEKKAKVDKEGFTVIFDGSSLKGWKVNERKSSWKLKKGVIIANGPRSHLFYVGAKKPFKNFEFKAEVMTKKGSNSGIFFHTKFQKSGWPKVGYESQVNNTQGDPQKTGGLYNTSKVSAKRNPAKDNKWWTQHIIVKGNHIVVKIDGKTVVDYKEPKGKKNYPRLSKNGGTFALQAHDPGSTVMYRNIRVKRLKD